MKYCSVGRDHLEIDGLASFHPFTCEEKGDPYSRDPNEVSTRFLSFPVSSCCQLLLITLATRNDHMEGRANWEVGRANGEVGRANWEVGRAILEVGRANWDLGRAHWEVGSANWEVGRANWKVGRAK